ncbi:serine protease [Streptomyces sp. DSM 44917]|uniref:Serine protease n=1 Tax=Streptomyces boetiae TaxID=3075541 RepID=A0ABU2LC05_9ACTN|nr:serine protease [Streptomyces sp. DSM 44917]MDT0309030.1 serine protease [Streptomyces sp. DSM 44917]
MGDNATERWLARIRESPQGPVLGAGVLLGEEHVLTCAHLLPGEDVPVTVEPVRDGPAGARVAEGGWAPERTDAAWGPSGDLALLRLSRPQPPGRGTRLLRLAPTRGREVRMYGFPDGAEAGLVLFGRLDGLMADGRVQISARRGSAAVVPGFSGGGVVDERTGRVIGIVVSTCRRGGISVSFMIPVETVLQHVPRVAAHVDGEAVADPGPAGADPGPGPEADPDADQLPEEDAEFAVRLADWLSGGESAAPVESAVVGPGDRARALPLDRALSLADRELPAPARAEHLANAPPGTVPPVGSLDLTVDATAQPTDRIAERVCGRMGITPGAGRTYAERLRSTPLPLTLVVRGVDRAPDGEGLLELLELLAEQGARVLLVFHGGDEAVREAATAALAFRSRLGAIDRRLGECAETGWRELHRRRQIVRVNAEPARDAMERATSALVRIPAQRARVARLGAQLQAGRCAGGGTGSWDAAGLERLGAALFAPARFAAAAGERVTEALAALDALIARRDELRERLTAVHLLAGDLDSPDGEDLALADLYRRARALLMQGPCDVPAADAAVAEYGAEVRRRLGQQRRRDREDGREADELPPGARPFLGPHRRPGPDPAGGPAGG